jgi:hypothetical protein
MSTAVSATPTFPDVTKTELQLPGSVACTLCHTDPGGGGGNVTQSVGVSLVARGMIPYDEALLKTALGKLKTDNVDSDLDGASDVEELLAGGDPNARAVDGEDGEPLTYGFGCSQSSAATPVIAVLLLLLRRRL